MAVLRSADQLLDEPAQAVDRTLRGQPQPRPLAPVPGVRPGMSNAGLARYVAQQRSQASQDRASAGTALLARVPDAGAPAAAPPAAEPVGARTKRPLSELEKQYRDIIAGAEKGHPVAAGNLKHFLDGGGATRPMSITWLRTFSAFTSAERKNQIRFEDQLRAKAKALKDGESITFADHWDAKVDASMVTELYYASGISQLRSKGSFTLSRKGTRVTIDGTVQQRWFDPYDWNPGQSAWIPGTGTISDDVGLDLKDAGRGKNYMLESLYSQTLTGTYDIEPWYLPDSDTFTWR